jgi:hypothetical protein
MDWKYKIVVSVIYQHFFNKIGEFVSNDFNEMLRIVDTQKLLQKQDINNKIDITVSKDDVYLFNTIV